MGGRRMAMFAALALCAVFAGGCVAEPGDSDDDEAVGSAESALVDDQGVSGANQQGGTLVITDTGSPNEDPEPSPWKGGAQSDDGNGDPSGDPGGPNMDPEPAPWHPGETRAFRTNITTK